MVRGIVADYALAAHGHPRYTGDIDFWLRPTAENIARLLGALTDFGFGSLGLTAAARPRERGARPVSEARRLIVVSFR